MSKQAHRSLKGRRGRSLSNCFSPPEDGEATDTASGVILGALGVTGMKEPNEQHSLESSHGSDIISLNTSSAHGSNA